MIKSDRWLPKAIATLFVIVLYAGVLQAAFANHGPGTIDATPEISRAPVGARVLITVRLSASADDPDSETGEVNIDAEVEQVDTQGPPPSSSDSVNDPDPTEGDATGESPAAPDYTCTIPFGGTHCTFAHFAHKGNTGRDQIRIWVDPNDPDDDDDAMAASDRDDTEMRNGDSDQTQAGEGDHCNSPGPADPPAPGNPSGEPDCTDVVFVDWSAASTQATTLDCDDSTGPDRERETNDHGQSETYECRIRKAGGSRDVQGTIYGEVENGVNDPDDTDGASYNEPDYFCVAQDSGSTQGDCSITVTQNEGESGTAVICFWTPHQETEAEFDNPATDIGAELCDPDPSDGDDEETMEATTATGADPNTGNDLADQVEKTWRGPGTTTATATATRTTTATTTATTTTATTRTTTSATTATRTTTTGSTATATRTETRTGTETRTETRTGTETRTQTTERTRTETPGTRRESTDLSISYVRPRFSGSARSGEGRCESNRLVIVRKQRPGPDRTVGSARTDRNGDYNVRSRRARGRYYAVAARKVFTDNDGTRVSCQRARSETIRVRR